MGRPTRRLGSLAIPIETLLLLRSLKEAADEEERKAIRVALSDIYRQSQSAEERDAITEALLDA